MLLKANDRAEWQGMKTLGMLRKEKGVKAAFQKDSQYQKVHKLLLLFLWEPWNFRNWSSLNGAANALVMWIVYPSHIPYLSLPIV